MSVRESIRVKEVVSDCFFVSQPKHKQTIPAAKNGAIEFLMFIEVLYLHQNTVESSKMFVLKGSVWYGCMKILLFRVYSQFLEGFELLECFFARITIMYGTTEGWPEGILELCIRSIAARANSMLQNL